MYIVLSQDGWTPLHVACQEGHVQVAELLLQAGASVEQETEVRWGVGQDWVVVERGKSVRLCWFRWTQLNIPQFSGSCKKQ